MERIWRATINSWNGLVAVTRSEAAFRQELGLLAIGYTNREAAGELHISVRTVETHRAAILAKLGVRTRAELVRYARASGMLG